ncbi:vacuole membrane protein Hfl1p [Trichomonascus vanleenenianus]|uniref:Hfl1p n=1 Tax=Trichomonascus vanleenenianus TaxID=2268995 RepID=UPI003ECB30FF
MDVLIAEEGFHIPKPLKIVTGVCAFGSIFISALSIFLHFKNYRKPMDQRLIVRIQLLLPLFALSSWCGLVSNPLSSVLEPIEEIYEAFVIYTFFTLLTNILGGERDIIISTSGRPPKDHLWPLNYFCDKVDISDPYTFLSIKRGILQYTWLKPFLSLATVLMNITDTYQSNTIGLKSGYMWIGLIYNVSITISLYSLALFWYCLLEDLAPYRPFPKFICVKIIIFFSYWQGFLLSILVYIGIIPAAGSSGSNNIARAIQNSLMCIEMLGFAIGHWFAFSYQDYATTKLIGFARLPVYYAIRDAFGAVDLMIDFKSTFYGRSYGYRQFDSVDDVLAHPESRSRRARMQEGLRYRNGGRSKYWLPKSTIAQDPLFVTDGYYHVQSQLKRGSIVSSYGTISGDVSPASSSDGVQSPVLFDSHAEIPSELHFNEEELQQDDALYDQARKLKYGDYNYPVITVRESIPYRPMVYDQNRAEDVQHALAQQYDELAGPDDLSDDDFFA